MDDREAVRITIAEARRKAGKKPARADVTAAVREGVLQALNAWEPEAEPVKFDALGSSVSADEMRRLFPDADPLLFRDRVPGTPRPTTTAMSETQKLRLQRAAEQRAAELADGAIDLRGANRDKTLQRYRQYGVTDPELLAGISDPVKAQPVPENDASRNVQRWGRARLQLGAARRIAAAYKQPIDVTDLSADAYALYLKEKGVDLNAPTLGSPRSPERK